MSNKTETKKATKKSNRIKYGFELNFPEKPFTIRELSRAKKGRVKYITLYMRVKKALNDGEIVEAGEKQPKTATRGRRQLIYKRADAKTAVASTSQVPAALATAA